MLSDPTLLLLKRLQHESHVAYPEGGLLYTYIEASNQAHSRLPSLRSNTRSAQLTAHEELELARFLQASQGNYQSQVAEISFISICRELLERLQVDLKFNEISWLLEDNGHDMSAVLKMARRSDNCFFALELMWSID